MIKSILTTTIVLSLIFIPACSEILDVTGDLAHSSSTANREITTKVESVSKWQMNQTKINVGAGASANETFTWTPQVGSHIIKAVADSYNTASESGETNNERTASLSTLPPDLIIETITWSPASPSVEDTVTFTVTIKNQGSGKSDYSRVAYYIDDAYLTLDYVDPIDPGASAIETFTWTAQAGSHAIKAVADSNNEVTESDETNNAKTITFPVPDLIIETITWWPESPSVEGTVTFTVTIKNQGSDKADYSHVAYYIDDAYLTSASVNPIDPGASANKTFRWIAQAGSHIIKAVADGDNFISESDETNNERTVTISPFLPPAPTPAPAPAPTPSTKPQEVPAGKPTPVHSPEKGIWPALLIAIAVVVLGGTVIMAILRFRHRYP